MTNGHRCPKGGRQKMKGKKMKQINKTLKFLIFISALLGFSGNVWGNSAVSANSSDDVSGGKIVMEGNHATFTFAAANTTITRGLTAYTLGSISHGESKECTFTWSAKDGCSIKVTKIEFGVRGYTTLATRTGEMKATFNGTTKEIGSILTTFTTFSATNNSGFSSGIKLTLKNTCGGHGIFSKTYDNFDYYIGDISITYTITPPAPTMKSTTTATINVSVTDETKLDMTTFVGVTNVGDFMPVAWSSKSYKTPENVAGTGAETFTGKYFYATKAGVYTYSNPYIAKKDGCHEKSSTTTGTITITVNRLPQTLTMKNGEVFATKDKNSPTTLDLSTLKTQTGNGNVTYELVAWPNAMNGKSAKDSCVINGKNFHAWVAGTYTLRAKAAVTDQYNAVTSENFTVNVKKNVTSINGTASYNLMVDGSTQIASYSTSNTSYATPLYGNTHDFYYTISNTMPANAVTTGCASGHASDVIGYTGSSHTITAYNAGTATLTLTQKETDVYSGASKTFNIEVYKYNSVFSGVTNLNTTVENTVTSGYVLTYTKPNSAYVGANHTAGTPTEGENSGNWYYVLGHKVTTDTQTDCPEAYKNVAITYAASSKTATGRNQGVDTVHLYQKETYKYNSSSTLFKVTVAKNSNTISYKWNNASRTAWNETMNFDEKASFTYSANNTVRPIGIEQVKGVTPGDTIAIYSTDTKKVTAYYNKGQAVWSLHQDENYKYVEANAKCTVTVAEMACETCYAYKLDPDNNVSKIGEIGWDIDSIAKVLTFDMRAYGTAWGDDALLSYWVIDGYVGPDEVKANNQVFYMPVEAKNLDPHTTGLKFEQGGDIVSTSVGTARTDDPKVDNIRVSRLTWLELNSTQTGKAFDTLYIYKELGEANKKGTFQLKVSTCDNTVKLASNDSKITLSETSVALASGSTYDGGYIDKNITVTYTCDKKDTTDAIISAYTKYEHKTFVVRAITKANDQEIVWKEGFEGDIVSLPVNGYVSITDAASASSGLTPILYSTNNSAVIEIAVDRKSFKVISAGSATLTASQEGDDEYEPTEDTKTIKGTEKIIQSIVWDDTFTRSMVVGTSKQMKASVDTLNTQTGAYDHSDARTAKLVYSCPKNNGVIEIVDSCYLHILSEGTTTVTASVEGDSHYEKASYTKHVSVRPASAGCESHSVYVQKDTMLFYIYDLNMPELTKTITFSPDSGVPDKLNFSVHGVSYHRIGRAFFEGDIDVYQSTNNGATWAKLTTIDAEQDSTVNSGDIQLDSTATMLKFVRPKGGQGYHYIEELVVSRKQILTAVNDTINLGDVPAGSIRTDKISFNYSETKSTELNVTKGKGDETYNTLEVDELVDIECGSFGQGDLEFKFKPTKVGTWSQTVTVTDPISTKTFTVTINANVTKGAQSIIWNPIVTTFYTVQAAELEAQLTTKSNRDLNVTYTASNSIVSFSGSTPTINGNGNVTIYADCEATDDYKDAEQVSHDFTINQTPTEIVTAPTLPTIIDGTKAEDVVLNITNASAKETVKNNTVAGSYTIYSPATLNAGTYNVTVKFTPSNQNLYAPSYITIENVTVEAPTYTFSGEGFWENTEAWEDNLVPASGQDIIVTGKLTIDGNHVVNGLTIEGNGSVTMVENGKLTVNGDTKEKAANETYGNLYIDKGGEVVLNGKLIVNDFTIVSAFPASDQAKSGQLDDNNNLSLVHNAYFDLSLDPSGTSTYGWYDFSVPFDVDANNGIYLQDGDKLAYGSQYAIIEFDEAVYAANKRAWKYNRTTLVPGKTYSISVANGVNNLRFVKVANAPIVANTSVAVTSTPKENADYQGWNGLGNSALQHAKVGLMTQVYNHADNCYVPMDANECSYVVGSAFFVQIKNQATNSVDLTVETSSKLRVAQRERAAEKFILNLEANGKTHDRIFLAANEDATNDYEIEHDLVKFGTPTDAKVAQMWANAYNMKLCAIETPMQEDVTFVDITLFSPKAGTYNLAIDKQPEEQLLYLMKDDAIIWNLSMSEYMLDLAQGTTEGYKLMIYRKPTVTTDTENIFGADNDGSKLMINGHLYIFRDGKMYDAQGRSIQ